MARFVEEEGLEREEKVEGVRGMLEGVVEGVRRAMLYLLQLTSGQGELPGEGVDDALGRVVDEWKRLQDEEAERRAQAAAEGEWIEVIACLWQKRSPRRRSSSKMYCRRLRPRRKPRRSDRLC